MFRFDIKSASWHIVKQKDDLPGGREGHTLCLNEEQIILFAGFKDGNKVNDLVKFSLSSSKWTDIFLNGVQPCPRSNHSALVF